MLLVDNGEAQVVEDDLALEERMRADDELRPAIGDGGQLVGAGHALVAPRQQCEMDADLVRQRRETGGVLAREDLGRRHQRGLAARLDGGQHGDERDQRLARADIALQQAHHAGGAGHVADDLVA